MKERVGVGNFTDKMCLRLPVDALLCLRLVAAWTVDIHPTLCAHHSVSSIDAGSRVQVPPPYETPHTSSTLKKLQGFATIALLLRPFGPYLYTNTMAVLSYNEILPKTVIEYENAPYEVLSSHIFRMQQRKPVNQTKLRHLISGRVIEISFHQSETVTEAEIEKMTAVYLYTNRGESWFSEAGNPKNRFSFPEDTVHDKVQWLIQNAEVEIMVYKEKPATLKIPIKVDLKVTEAPPAVKGDTATGGNKLVTLESGATVLTPLFINPGDILRINTETGDYVERVEKA